MESLFVVAVFAIAGVCGVAIVAVACRKPEGDSQQKPDVRESHPLEAATH